MLQVLRNSTIRNMKKLFFLFATLAITVSAVAQDIIVTKDSKKIEAKILEVSKSEIKYKEFDYQDGPTFILETKEINSITYANGKVVVYGQLPENKEEQESARKQREAEALSKANAIGSLFGNTGADVKGSSVGPGTSGGCSWSLIGRSIKGTLPQPSNTFNQEGKVIVQIRVNAAGKVVEVKHVDGNINDRQTIQLALDAAKKAKFTEGDHDQIGTITYNFKFN